MNLLGGLTSEEQRALVHLLENQRGKAEFGEEDLEDIYEYLIEFSPVIERKLA